MSRHFLIIFRAKSEYRKKLDFLPSYIKGFNYTYWKVNGLLKKMNDITIVIAFLQVVTVTAAKAPEVLTNVKTTCMPKYPVTENIKAYPYILFGF